MGIEVVVSIFLYGNKETLDKLMKTPEVSKMVKDHELWEPEIEQFDKYIRIRGGRKYTPPLNWILSVSKTYKIRIEAGHTNSHMYGLIIADAKNNIMTHSRYEIGNDYCLNEDEDEYILGGKYKEFFEKFQLTGHGG